MASPIVPIAVVVVVVALAAVVYYFYPDLLAQTTQVQPPEEGRAITMTGLEVAAGMAGWAEQMRAAGGEVHNTYHCDQNGFACGGGGGATVVNNVMLYLLYSKISESDVSYSGDADREFQFLSQRCEESDEVGCRGYYILAMSDGGVEDSVISEAGDRFIDSNYTESMQDTIRILSAIHRADGDPIIVEQANLLVEQAKNLLGEFKDATSGNNRLITYAGGVGMFDCAVRNSEMDVYSMSGDEALLGSVKSFFDEKDVVVAVGEMENSLQAIECAEAAGKLADATGDAAYRQTSLEVTRYLVDAFWDAGARPLLYANNGLVSGRLFPDLQIAEGTLRAGALAARFPGEVMLEVGAN